MNAKTTQATDSRPMRGGFFNRVMEQGKMPAPVVGMGATELWYSDRKAGTVVEVNAKGTRLVWQEDKATRTDTNGMSDSQAYSYEANPEGTKVVYTLRKNGRWVAQGQGAKNGRSLSLGNRSAYHDYSF
jgi:hypothetical protein